MGLLDGEGEVAKDSLDLDVEALRRALLDELRGGGGFLRTRHEAQSITARALGEPQAL